jgi:hypothetical protein
MGTQVVMAVLLATTTAIGGESKPEQPRRYRDPLLPLLAGGIIGPAEKTLIFRARGSGGAIPPAGQKLEIRAAAGTIILESDADGFVRWPFNLELLRENPPVRKLDATLTFDLLIAATFKSGVQERVELSAGQKAFVEEGAIRVWHTAGQAAAARELLERLVNQHSFIEKELGIVPLPWGINLVDDDLSGMNVTTLQDYPQWFTWSFSLQELGSREAERVNMHEWVEQSLSDRLEIESAEDKGWDRFVGDGLAEYVSIRCLRSIPAHYPELFEQLLTRGEIRVNLPERFRWATVGGASPAGLEASLEGQFRAGYALSFVFWERTCAEHGRDLPKRYLAALGSGGRKDYESRLRVLAQLTGSEAVRSRLEAMDVREALQQLRDLSEWQEDRRPTTSSVCGAAGRE